MNIWTTYLLDIWTSGPLNFCSDLKKFSCPKDQLSKKIRCSKVQMMSKNSVVQKLRYLEFSCLKDQLSKSSDVQKFSCPESQISGVQLSKRSVVQKVRCSYIWSSVVKDQLSKSSDVQKFSCQRSVVKMFKCPKVQMFKSSVVQNLRYLEFSWLKFSYQKLRCLSLEGGGKRVSFKSTFRIVHKRKSFHGFYDHLSSD